MVGRAAALQSVLVLARQASRARKLSISVRQAAAPLHRALGAARPTPLAAPSRPCGALSRWSTSQRGLATACTRAAVEEEMAAAATSAAAQRPFLLPEELRAQFSQQIDVMAIRMPKQSSNQYMKRLSK